MKGLLPAATFALLLVSVLSARAQMPSNRYLIFTFEERYKNSPHGTKTFYWMQQADSVAAHPLRLAALFLSTSAYSKDNLDDICQGLPTDPFLQKISTNYGFSEQYMAGTTALQELIAKHRTRVQTIRKSWANGQSALIQVYATPITGQFCAGRLRRREADGDQYDGPLFIPFADFRFIPEKADEQPSRKRWAAEDFSQVNYAIFSSAHFSK